MFGKKIDNNLKNLYGYAFTLAEVLIVLGVIGIIAEMTIPTLMNNTQNQVYKSSWKKNYSVISQAALMIRNDNGGTLEGFFTSADSVKEAFKPYFRYTKDCNAADGCRTPLYQMNGTYVNSVANTPTLILADGSILYFGFNTAACNTKNGSSGINSCADVEIDVNGLKKPNVAGKDIYGIWIQSDKEVPFGAQGDAGAYNFSDCPDNMPSGWVPGVIGWGCSAKYLYN